MAYPAPARFRLDDDHVDLIRLCLRKGAQAQGVPAPDGEVRRAFANAVEEAINSFIVEFVGKMNNPIVPSTRDKLAALYQLASNEQVDQLRLEIAGLPTSILEFLEERAAQTVPKFLETSPAPRAQKEWGTSNQLRYANFSSWAKNAGPEELVRGVIAVVCDGWLPVLGKSRKGTRSRSKFAPIIAGRVIGKPTNAKDKRTDRGRQPVPVSHFVLIGHLAVAWENATGMMPKVGRSDYTGFGDLVYQVFAWLHEFDERFNPETAAHSLREYSRSLHGSVAPMS